MLNFQFLKIGFHSSHENSVVEGNDVSSFLFQIHLLSNLIIFLLIVSCDRLVFADNLIEFYTKSEDLGDRINAT